MSEEKTYFHHYAGSKKPWYFENVFNDISEYYQQAYKNLFNNKFHVTMKFKKHEIKVLINILISRKFKLRDKVQLIYGTFKTKILGSSVAAYCKETFFLTASTKNSSSFLEVRYSPS